MGVDGDWTWVLQRVCPDCASDVLALPRDGLGPRARTVGGSWRVLLDGGGAALSRPPINQQRTWSALEYGCHVADVFERFEERLRLMLKKRKPPTFQDWDQERAAIDNDYANQDPAHIAYVLASNAGKVADVLDRVGGDEWDKRGVRSDGVEFTVDTLARYMLHDAEHHLWDARQLLS